MGRPALILVLAVTLLPAMARADDDAELKKLEGTWKMTAEVRDGKKRVPPDSWQIKGTRVTVLVNKNPFGDGNVIKIDASKNPKTIDSAMLFRDFTTKKLAPGTALLGIYEVNGDELKVCFYFIAGENKDKIRPKDFTAPKGSLNKLLIFKREKR